MKKMNGYDLEGLRGRLFRVIDLLTGDTPDDDEAGDIDIATAEAVVKCAAVVVDSAKVEVQFLRATNCEPRTALFGKPARQLGPPENS